MRCKAMLTGIGLGATLAFASLFPSVHYVRNRCVIVASAAEQNEAKEASENDPVAEDKELSANIKREKGEGNDVSAAVAHQQKGEAAMKTGNTKEALEHFEEGERALGEAEEHEKGEKGEKGGY